MENKKIKNFTDLIAWQKAHEAALNIYAITQKFPEKEVYALTSQMRRAAVSVTSNLAEGFSRHSLKEKINFYSMALGSTTELQNQLLFSKDVGYTGKPEFETTMDQLTTINKLINGLIKSLRNL